MFLKNETDENVCYTIHGFKEKCILSPNEIVEFQCLGEFSLEILHTIPSNYYYEKFTKCPKSSIRVNSTLFIEDAKKETELIIYKSVQQIDNIFSYVFFMCSITDGDIKNEEYHIIDSQAIIEKHKKHQKKDLRDDFLIIPFAFVDIGFLIFIWKWLGFKKALLMLIVSLIFYFILNGIVTLFFLIFQKNENEYLNYFDENTIKMRKTRDG